MPFLIWKCQGNLNNHSKAPMWSFYFLISCFLCTQCERVSPLYMSVDCKYFTCGQTWWWWEDGCSLCYILEGFLWFRQISFIWYFSLISLLSSVCSTINRDDEFCYKISKYVDDEQLQTSVCYCYAQKHAMTVCNVAIAQSLVTPTCKSQLKLTQELYF